MSFKDAVVYQIYPRSFRDSTGDGVGDLRGIVEKVPYIASLGVDYVWLNPFFPSPGRDNGYDVSDYCAVDPVMGTLEDFDDLVAALDAHGIGVMLDMVLNHTSTEHEWFQRALAGEQRYRDYYYIRPAREEGSPPTELPTNWVSKFGGPAWAPFGPVDEGGRPRSGEYYLHLYDPGQADLDWHNPEVRARAAEVVNFWRARGVRAFRFDVVNLIGKPEPFIDAPAGTDDRAVYTDGPLVHTYLRELNEASFGQDPDSVTVGEMSSTSIAACVEYTRPENHELSMVFNFHHLKVDYAEGRKWTLMTPDVLALKRILNDWTLGLQAGGGWNALFWNNHDQPRAINRFCDPDRFRYESAAMLATAIHLMRGTPYIYMGEEIGMSDPGYTSIEDYVDVEARNAFIELLQEGREAVGREHRRWIHRRYPLVAPHRPGRGQRHPRGGVWAHPPLLQKAHRPAQDHARGLRGDLRALRPRPPGRPGLHSPPRAASSAGHLQLPRARNRDRRARGPSRRRSTHLQLPGPTAASADAVAPLRGAGPSRPSRDGPLTPL